MKKSICLLLVLVLVIGLLPPGIAKADAPFAGGDGTAGNPYLVATAAQLNLVRSYLNKHFRLAANIDLGAYNAGAGWEPIGNIGAPGGALFTGSFDGGTYVITGLTINNPAQNTVGLFGCTDFTAVIKNLKLVGASVSGDYYVGGLVGENYGAIQNSYATGTVTGDDVVGGLVGRNYGTIKNSFATGTVTGLVTVVGGLVGVNFSTIENSYATGEVTGNALVGGLVGWHYSGTITKSYATGAVTGSDFVGGLVGSKPIQFSPVVTDSYYDRMTSRQGDTGKGVAKTSAEMTQAITFTGWDFDTTWNINEGTSYPYLRWSSHIPTPPLTISGTFTVQNKEYDGTNTATIDATGLMLVGAAPGDEVTLNVVAAFANASVGDGKNVSLTGSSLIGDDAHKYTLSFAGAPTRTANITAKAISVTANNRSKTYGETLVLGTTEFTITADVLVPGDDITSVTLTSAGAVSTAPVTSYDVIPSLATGTGVSNYNITYANGTLTVNTKPITVTANNRSKTYGEALVLGTTEFTTAPGAIETGDAITGVTLTSAGAVSTAPVTSYDVIPSLATGTGVSNYNITYANGTLTVNTKPISVTANNRSKTYGEALVLGTTEFTTAPGAIETGDAITGVTLTSAGAVSTAPVTSYDVIPSVATGTGVANYDITYLSGSLTVSTAPLTITANPRSKYHGDPDPSLTWRITTGALVGADAITGSLVRTPGESVGTLYPIL